MVRFCGGALSRPGVQGGLCSCSQRFLLRPPDPLQAFSARNHEFRRCCPSQFEIHCSAAAAVELEIRIAVRLLRLARRRPSQRALCEDMERVSVGQFSNEVVVGLLASFPSILDLRVGSPAPTLPWLPCSAAPVRRPSLPCRGIATRNERPQRRASWRIRSSSRFETISTSFILSIIQISNLGCGPSHFLKCAALTRAWTARGQEARAAVPTETTQIG